MALTPSQIRRRKLNMLMSMSYAAFASSKAWTLAKLFANGEQGFWYDPSDFSTMFQDSAGTTPVTAVGDYVGLIRDKSGRGNHASQSSSTSRPQLGQDASGKYYLSFDGVDDYLVTLALNLSPSYQMATVAGVRKVADTAGVIIEGGTTINSGTGKFTLRTDPNPDFSFVSRGTINAQPTSVATYPVPSTVVLTGLGDIQNDLATLRVNGAEVSQVTTDQGTGPFGSHDYYFGMRAGATVPFTGLLYGLVVVGRSVVGLELSNTETWMNGKTGAY